jgi:hypothetical protein
MSAWYATDGISVELALTTARAELPPNARDQSVQSAQTAIDCLLLLTRGDERKAEELLKRHSPEELGEILLALATLTLEHSHALEGQPAARTVAQTLSRVRDRAIDDLRAQVARLSIELDELRKRVSNRTQVTKAVGRRSAGFAPRPAAKRAAKRK